MTPSAGIPPLPTKEKAYEINRIRLVVIFGKRWDRLLTCGNKQGLLRLAFRYAQIQNEGAWNIARRIREQAEAL